MTTELDPTAVISMQASKLSRTRIQVAAFRERALVCKSHATPWVIVDEHQCYNCD